MRGLTTVYLDIETIPGPTPPPLIWPADPGLADLKAPANYKDEAKIEEWLKAAECRAIESYEHGLAQMKANQEAQWATESLDSMRGRILCIGAAIEDDPAEVFCRSPETPEGLRETLDDFHFWVADTLGAGPASIKWVGFNLRSFDLRWIYHHAVKYKLTRLASIIPRERYSKAVEDVRDIWSGGEYGDRTKLSDLAAFLGLEGKGEGLDGSKIWDAYRAGRLDEICDYCARDVALTREIHQRLLGRL